VQKRLNQPRCCLGGKADFSVGLWLRKRIQLTVVNSGARQSRLANPAVVEAVGWNLKPNCQYKAYHAKQGNGRVDSKLRRRCTDDDEYCTWSIVWLGWNRWTGFGCYRPMRSFRRFGVGLHTRRYKGPLCENMTSSAIPEVHNIVATSPEEDQTTVRVNVHRKIGEILPCGFWDTRPDRQTDRQTYSTHHDTSHLSGRDRRWRSKKLNLPRASLIHLPPLQPFTSRLLK